MDEWLGWVAGLDAAGVYGRVAGLGDCLGSSGAAGTAPELLFWGLLCPAYAFCMQSWPTVAAPGPAPPACPQLPGPTCPAPFLQLGEEGALNVFNSKHNKWHTFRFDKVFGEGSAQEAVYAETQPLIRSVLDGGWVAVCVCWWGGVAGTPELRLVEHPANATCIECIE